MVTAIPKAAGTRRHDGTEEGMAERLVEQGVPRSDIVLAFHAPSVRKYTAYAVG